jgi:hypothetical protein
MAGSLIFFLHLGSGTQAAPIYWNPGGTGGSEFWSSMPGDKNWNVISGASTGNTSWQNDIDDVAVFDDSLGGTVTVFDSVQAAGIIQNDADYIIEAGSIVLAADSLSNVPSVHVQGSMLTINSALEGSDGMVKSGSGTLLLTAENAYTGITTIQGGTLNLTGSLASSSLSISSAASLLNQNGGLSSGASLINAGVLTLSANDTINSYASNGGTLNNGPGTLFTTSVELNDGSSVDGRLSAITLASNGVTSINGTATTGNAAIQSGILSLVGTLAGNSVQISNGASLLNQSSGLSSGAILTNSGSLTMNASDTVASYISNGGNLTAGAGTLFASTVELNDGSSVAGRLYADNIASNGAVTMSGIVTGKMSTSVQSGILNFTGTLTTTNLDIEGGAILIQNGNIVSNSTATRVTNSGELILQKSTSLKAYITNGGLLDIQDGRMITQTVALNDGSITKGGLFSADLLTTNGAVRVENGALGARAIVESGVLDLVGSLGANKVEIANSASLLDQNGGLSGNATVTNAGSLVLLNSDQIAAYTSNGGLLDVQNGTLTTPQMNLNDGSITRGSANTNQLVANGNVRIEGRIIGDTSNIASGVLTLTGTLGLTNTNIATGATLLNQGGGFTHTISLTNSGTLGLQTNATVRDYISNGGTLTVGAGTLFATRTDLNDGSTLAGQLNTGTLTSNGIASISGTATAGNTAIQSGSLSLSGVIASNSVLISNGASLVNQNGGLSNSATLTNEGSLTLNINDSIASYISNGGTLAVGAGTLFATNSALNNGSTLAGQINTNTLTSNGAVLLSGIATAGTVSIQEDRLTLSGTLNSNTVQIARGAFLVNHSGGLSSGANITNAGALTIYANDTVENYISNGGTLTNGPRTLFATNSFLNTGSSVVGLLNTKSLVSSGGNGVVTIHSTTTAGDTLIQSGRLILNGTLASDSVQIASSALLLNQKDGLSSSAILTNSGSLTLNANDTIANYISNGGTLAAGAGTLFATRTDLNDGSTVAGQLNTNTLTSNGAVLLSGTATAGTVSIQSGTLTNSGTLGNASTLLNIHQGASLMAGGVQQYIMLTTSGSGAATWSGDLINPAALAPGGLAGIGRLDVSGNFANSPAGLLRMDLSAAQSDYLSVSGSANLDGMLDLNQGAGAAISSFVPVQIIGSSAYSGNFTSITENLDGAVWFNPGNGTITRLAFPTGGGPSLFGLTNNQSSSWISLYDDVIDSGKTNITANPGGDPPYDITSGIASAENPDLLWALAASFTPGGLDSNLLNRLSPEVYTSFSDYATQATRSHQRAALNAPALAPVKSTTSSKAGMDSAKEALASPANVGIEFFAALDSFHVETDNSLNHGDYALDGTGLIAGMRGQPHELFTLAGYLAGNDGSVDGPLIDTDAFGWSMGLIGEWMIDPKSSTHLIGAVSYGSYTFDGERGSASASTAGWAPGDVDISGIGQDSLEIFLGLDSTIYQHDNFRLIPSAGLRYASGTMDDIREEAGSGIALDVAADRHESMLMELSLLAEMDWNDRLTLRGQIGANAALMDDDNVLQAKFVDGNRPMRITAEGLTDDLFFLNLGAEYRLNDSASIGLGYRSEFRSSHHMLHGLSLSSSFRF